MDSPAADLPAFPRPGGAGPARSPDPFPAARPTASGGDAVGDGDGWPVPGGPPLTWADLLPGWPDDVTLEPEESRDAAPSTSAPENLAVRPPWASPAGTPRPQPLPLPPPALSPAGRFPLASPPSVVSPPGLFTPVSAEDDEEYSADEDGPLLSGASAFGGAARSRFGAFDPGRRGVRALAVVAIIVVVVAALLAWRARPRVDPVAPPGIDPAAAAASLTDAATDTPAAPGAKPSAAAAVVVAVGGKVRKPGLVELPPGARVADALRAAGGANPGVDVAPLNLARKVTDGELIMVGVTLPPGAAPTAPAGVVSRPGAAGAPGQPGAGPVNLNTATLADLDTLPGVGPVLAQRILEAREAQGGFRAVSDLRKVEGIGTARYEQLKDLVTV